MLCLQAEPAVFKMIAGVELHTRLRGPDFHDASAPRLAGARSQHEGSAVAVQNKVVVIAAWFWLELIDARADACRRRKIQRRAFHTGDFAGGNQLVVRRRIAVRGEPQFVVENVAGASEIKIGVIGQIDRRGLVGGGFVVEAQFVVVRERIRHLDREIAGITFLAILAQVGELDGRFVLARRKRLRLPDHLGESLASTVEVVRSIVGGEFVFHAVEREPGSGDPIGNPPNDRSRSRKPFAILIEVGGAQHHVGHRAVAIGHFDLGDNRAVDHDFGRHALGVTKREELHDRALRRSAKFLFFESAHGGFAVGPAERSRQCQRDQNGVGFEKAHDRIFGPRSSEGNLNLTLPIIVTGNGCRTRDAAARHSRLLEQLVAVRR